MGSSEKYLMASEALYAVPHKQLELVYAWLLQNPPIIDSFHTFLLHGGTETPRMLTACALFARICSIDLRTLIRGRPAVQTHREQDRPYCILAEKGHVFDAVYNTLLQMLKVSAQSYVSLLTMHHICLLSIVRSSTFAHLSIWSATSI